MRSLSPFAPDAQRGVVLEIPAVDADQFGCAAGRRRRSSTMSELRSRGQSSLSVRSR